MATPFAVAHLGVVGSTQDEARARFAGDPVLVTATAQTAGRGRSGAQWRTADRAIAASLAFAPGWEAAAWPRLTLVAGLAARTVAGEDVRLEWPNDVVLGDVKVAGLLTESAGGAVVVGLGMNLFWPSPLPGTGALLEEDPGPDRSRELAEAWAADLLRRIEPGPERWGRQEYESFCVTVGRDVAWDPAGRGRAVGVAADGGLEVETKQGPVVLHSGEVRNVRFSSPEP